MTDINARRDAQVDIEHAYYEDSGLADRYARRIVDFHAKLLSSVLPAASQQQRYLNLSEAPPDSLVAAGAPPGHVITDSAAVSGQPTNVFALAILNQVQFSNSNDAPVLQFCSGLSVEPCEAPKVEPEAPMGLKVTLHFSKNSYFSDERISRIFGYATTATDDFDFVSAGEGVVIHWHHPSKDVTVKAVKRTRGSHSTESRRVPVISLFRLFTADGLEPFDSSIRGTILNTIKPLIKVAIFTVHAAAGTRRDPGASEGES